MSNTITDLIPSLYSALDVVSRELTGFIPAVTRDMTTSRAALNQTVISFVTPASTATDITPAVTPPDSGDQTIGEVQLSITKARMVPVRWNGEQSLGLNNSGPGVNPIIADQMAQAMRTLVNEVEADLAGLHIAASRAYGTATTQPFASNLGDIAQMRKILADNGAPESDWQAVISTGAGAAMRTLTQLTKANEAGSVDMLRRGTLTDLEGFNIRESAQIKRPAAGTGTNYVSNNVAGYAIGTTSIAVDVGSGTVLAGDVIAWAGDTNKYVVVSSTGGGTVTNVVIAAPGLQASLADDVAMTIVAVSGRNMFFRKSALILATRLPALPADGDLATDRTTIVDAQSGLAFEFAVYPQYRQTQFQLGLAWGVKCVKPEHTGILLGA